MIGILIRIARAVLRMVLQQLMQQFNILQEEVMSPMRQMIQQVTDGIWIGEGANAGFVQKLDREHLRLRVHERGAGCGGTRLAAWVSPLAS